MTKAARAPRPSRPSRIAVELFFAFAGWTLIGALGLARRVVLIATQGGELAPGEIAEHCETIWLWALFTPLVFRLAERCPIERVRWARRVALHGIFAFALSAADVAIDHVVIPLLSPHARPFAERFIGESFINVFSYFALLSIGLALRFYRLYHERLLASSRLETELAEAKLRALEMRLRPHFLYNALHTIGGLVRTSQPAAAVRMIAGLGDLLRHTLREDDAHEVPLARELELTLSYLAIEQARFGDKLRVHLEISPETEDARVPSLLLQPLVENAVRHGIEPSAEGGELFVRSYRRGDALCLEVEDTGRGPRGDEARGARADRPKIGLATTRARLAHLYGSEQRLDLERAPGGGALATIRVPFRAGRGPA